MGYIIIYYLKFKQSIITKIFKPLIKFFKVNLLYIVSFVFIIMITTAAIQKDNILKFISWTSEIFSIQLYNNYNEIEENENLISADKNSKVYYDFENVEKDLKIEILKPSYIPSEFTIDNIVVIYDTNINIRIVAKYVSEKQEKALVYSIYIAKDNNAVSKIIQEKKRETSVKEYKTNKTLKNCYFLYNVDWTICVFEDASNKGNCKIFYEIYGLNSEEEMKKIKSMLAKLLLPILTIFIVAKFPAPVLGKESILRINNIISEEKELFESKLIGSYSITLYEENGLLKISTTVISPYTLEYLGVHINLQELIGNSWTTIAQFDDNTNNNYIFSTKDSYIPVSGSKYRAQVSFTAKKGSINETKSSTSDTKKF